MKRNRKIEDTFWKKQYDNCASDSECVTILLKKRGFLIEEIGGELYLSDNSHVDDIKYLNKVLVESNCGIVKNNKVFLEKKCDYTVLEKILFNPFEVESTEECHEFYNWKYFRNRRHGYKVQVERLEPFIAMYVKAISACGVITTGSCDGGKDEQKCAFLQISVSGSKEWHRLLWEEVLYKRYPIRLSEDCTAFFFDEDMYRVYYILLEAAEFLYNNREVLRQTKRKAFDGMTQRYLKETEYECVKNQFMDKARKLLRDLTFS